MRFPGNLPTQADLRVSLGISLRLAEMRGSKESLHFSMSRREMREACFAGAQRKKCQTRPLLERSGIHLTIEPGSP